MHCLAYHGTEFDCNAITWSHRGLFQGKGVSTSRVSPPGPLSLSLSHTHTHSLPLSHLAHLLHVHLMRVRRLVVVHHLLRHVRRRHSTAHMSLLLLLLLMLLVVLVVRVELLRHARRRVHGLPVLRVAPAHSASHVSSLSLSLSQVHSPPASLLTCCCCKSGAAMAVEAPGSAEGSPPSEGKLSASSGGGSGICSGAMSTPSSCQG
jgi:hypothetical protein